MGQKPDSSVSTRENQGLDSKSRSLAANSTFAAKVKKIIGQSIFSLLGWSIEGSIDSSLAKSVIIIAPHNTGFLDIIVGWSVRAQQPIPGNRFMAKKEAYDHAIYGGLLRRLGAMRVDREHADGLVGSVVSTIQKDLCHNLVITPEGTRTQGVPWKTGFYRIALQAKVPLVLVGFDYDNKKVHISDAIELTGNHSSDESYIKDWYEKNIPGFVCRLSLQEK